MFKARSANSLHNHCVIASRASARLPPHNHQLLSDMSHSTSNKATVHLPPITPLINRPSVILYGAIHSDPNNDWQTRLTALLSDLPIAILNPRRDDWDSSWIEDISFAPFKEQVEWEMDHARIADVIVFYFAGEAKQPITLLELGLYAGTGKAIVCCPEGFWKRGNVQMVCERYNIDLVDSVEELGDKVRAMLLPKLLEVPTARKPENAV
jgi:hypothetical protein